MLHCPGIVQVSDVLTVLLSSQICGDFFDLKVAIREYIINWNDLTGKYPSFT